MDIEFSSVEELYKRLTPALKVKKTEAYNYGYGYLKIEDIWNYLKDKVWKNSRGLSLNDMVSDIMNCSLEEIDYYFKENLSKKNRKVFLDDF